MVGDLNKRALECLIKSGAFDSLSGTRAQKLAVYEEIIDSESRANKNNIEGQFSFFGNNEEKTDVFPEKVYEYSTRELLSMEKEMAGIYLSGHPLDEYREKILRLHYDKCGEITGECEENQNCYSDGQNVCICAIISERRDKLTRSNTTMSFLNVEDFTGSIEVIVFPKTLTKLDSILAENSIVILNGRLDIKDEEPTKLILESATPLTDGNDKNLVLKLDNEKIYLLDRIKPYIIQNSGQNKVIIEYNNSVYETEFFTDASETLISSINKICGGEVAFLK